MAVGMFVQAAKLAACAAKIAQAIVIYRGAANEAKAAAADLASKWEGDAQKVFVAEQEKAYNWYVSIADVVSAFVDTLKKTAERYERLEEAIKARITSH